MKFFGEPELCLVAWIPGSDSKETTKLPAFLEPTSKVKGAGDDDEEDEGEDEDEDEAGRGWQGPQWRRMFLSFQPLLPLIKSGTSMDCVEALKGLQARRVPIFLR